MRGFVRRFRIVPGERISPNAIVWSSTTKNVPFGETFGVPSGDVVATNPSSCSSTIRFISAVSMFGFLRCTAGASVDSSQPDVTGVTKGIEIQGPCRMMARQHASLPPTLPKNGRRTPMGKRINRCVELLEQDQAIYYDGAHSGHVLTQAQGRIDAATWADYVNVGMEHGACDMAGLAEYMRGMVDAAP